MSMRLIPPPPPPPSPPGGDPSLSASPVAPAAPFPSTDCTSLCLAYAVGKVAAAAAPTVLPASALCADLAGQGYYEQCLTWSGPECRNTLNSVAGGSRTQYVVGCPGVSNVPRPSPTLRQQPSPTTPAQITPATPGQVSPAPSAATPPPPPSSPSAEKTSPTSPTRPTSSSSTSPSPSSSSQISTSPPATPANTLAPLPSLPLSTAPSGGAQTTSLSDSAHNNAGSGPSLAVVIAIGVAIGLLIVALIILGLHLRARRRAKTHFDGGAGGYFHGGGAESLEEQVVVGESDKTTAVGTDATAAAVVGADALAPQRPRKAAARTNPAVQSWLRAGAAAAAGNNVNGLLGIKGGGGGSGGPSAVSSRHGSEGSLESTGWRDSLDGAAGVGAPYRDLLPASVDGGGGGGFGNGFAPPLVQTSPVRQVWDATAWCEINITPAMRVETWAALADGWCVVMWAGSDDEPPQTGLVPTSALIRPPPSRPLTRTTFLAHPSHMSALPAHSPGAARAKRDFYIRALASGLLSPAARRPWASELARGASDSSGRDSSGSGSLAGGKGGGGGGGGHRFYDTRAGGLAGRMSADGRVVVGEGRESFGVPPRRAAGLMGRIRSGESLHSAFIPKDQW
ncbi:hypothetical protein HDU86_004957 [Geranomyces michiganensis]|nr:hypothetical protein HDU86_004957 [Geranomyces michiganensis]